MDTKRPSGGESSEVREGVRPGLVSRRGFARAGLSGSVLLGSLASKPVLGASVGCTVSGQMSGNLSREAQVFDCTIGKTPAEWLTAPWPLGFDKGTFPKTNCKFEGSYVQGTLFNGAPKDAAKVLMDSFYRSKSSSSCIVVTDPVGSFGPASMYQVLATTDSGEQFRLGRIVAASLLNIADLGESLYPVTSSTVIDMFNATFGGGSYVDKATWARGRVIEYLESLVGSDG